MNAISDTPDARYVVTGPSGWIGSALLALLARRLGPEWRDHVTCFGSSDRLLDHPAGVVRVRALEDIGPHDVANARVFHLAYLTKDRIGASADGAFVERNLAIDDLVLGAVRQGRPQAVFVASSGAAEGAARRTERNLYGLTKLIQEDRFLDYVAGGGAPALVGRIFNIAGPYINKIGSYALSSLLSQGISTGRMTIGATVPVFRSYLDVEDLLLLILEEMSDPLDLWRGPVDLCGALVVEMADVAAAAAGALGLDPTTAVSRGEVSLSTVSRYLGDPAPARLLALKRGLSLRTFEDQVARTAADLRGRLSGRSGPEASRA